MGDAQELPPHLGGDERPSKRPRDPSDGQVDARGRPIVFDAVTLFCDNLCVRSIANVKHLDANHAGLGTFTADGVRSVAIDEHIKFVLVRDMFSDPRVAKAMRLFSELVKKSEEEAVPADEFAFWLKNGFVQSKGGADELARQIWHPNPGASLFASIGSRGESSERSEASEK